MALMMLIGGILLFLLLLGRNVLDQDTFLQKMMYVSLFVGVIGAYLYIGHAYKLAITLLQPMLFFNGYFVLKNLFIMVYKREPADGVGFEFDTMAD